MTQVPNKLFWVLLASWIAKLGMEIETSGYNSDSQRHPLLNLQKWSKNKKGMHKGCETILHLERFVKQVEDESVLPVIL